MIFDQTGSVANVKRHDYLPFGEELIAGTGGRTAAQGYSGADGVRQQFTDKERDFETGLDYFLARYYSSIQGRFMSPDEFKGGPRDAGVLGSGDPEKQALVYAQITNPQSLNKYQYSLNNPLRYVDPDGQEPQDGYELQLRRDEKALLEGRMTPQEFQARQNARGVGAAIGAVVLAAILRGREIGAAVLLWAASNPNKVEQIAQVTQEALGGPPAMITGVTRMTQAELSMAGYLAANGQNVEKLAVSTVQGVRTADFAVNGIAVELKTIGAQGGANTLKNAIASAVGQGRGNVLIDARDAVRITVAEAQQAAARVFGADSRLQVVRVVGKDFDVTIARQSH
jgi:RHS repeat-associated protein